MHSHDNQNVLNNIVKPSIWIALTPTTDFNKTPPSTSSITMVTDQTANIVAGMPLKYKVSGTYYYGIVKTMATFTLSIQGAPVSVTADSLEELYYGPVTSVQSLDLFISGAYGGSLSNALYNTKTKSKVRWRLSDSYIVSFSAIHNTNAGTNQPKVNILADNSAVSTYDTNKGIQLSTSWVTNPDIEINTTNYAVSQNEEIEIKLSEVDSPAGSATDLTVSILFVMKN